MTLPVGADRPGGRTARTRRAVLQETRREVLRHGYSDLNIERIAGRAGVHKTTIYRRWHDRTGLVTDLIGTMAHATIPVFDTGSVGRDLQLFARDLRSFLSGDSGKFVATMLEAAHHDNVLARRIRSILDDRYAATATIIERAVDRGELPLQVDPHAVIRQVASPLYYDRIVRGITPSARDSDQAAAAGLAAARAETLTR